MKSSMSIFHPRPFKAIGDGCKVYTRRPQIIQIATGAQARVAWPSKSEKPLAGWHFGLCDL